MGCCIVGHCQSGSFRPAELPCKGIRLNICLLNNTSSVNHLRSSRLYFFLKNGGLDPLHCLGIRSVPCPPLFPCSSGAIECSTLQHTPHTTHTHHTHTHTHTHTQLTHTRHHYTATAAGIHRYRTNRNGQCPLEKTVL